MIKNKFTDKLVFIVTAVVLLSALLLQSAASQSGESSGVFTQYESELFGSSIISLDIKTDQQAWDEMIANAEAKSYIMVDVVVNGVTYQSVGVRTKGNASLTQVSQSASPQRYSFRIKFDEYIEASTLLGLDELVLNNMISDPSYMKEYLSQELMRYIGVEAPLTNYASLSVNGEGIGFYVALESYGSSYNRRVYGDNKSNYYNVKTMEMGGGDGNRMGGNFAFGGAPDQANQQVPGSEDWQDRQGFVGRGGGSRGGSLEYVDDNVESYPAIFDNALQNTSSSEQQSVISALKALSDGENIESHFDADQILRYFAAHTFLVSMDSYYSNMAQNYVIQERGSVISILPWDYHLSYGSFQSGSASDVVNAPIDTPLSGVTMESRPLLNTLLSNEEYLDLYHQYLNQMVTEYFGNGVFEESVRALQTKISTYVQNDPTAFTGYDEFITAVDTLIDLNLLRAQSIAGQLEGTIPATTEGQSADSSSLVDSSQIDMSNLGSHGMGGGFGNQLEDNAGNQGEIPDGGFLGGMPGGQMGENPNNLFENMPDQEIMRQAMEILQQAAGELTDEVKEKLLALGITEEQLEFFTNMNRPFGMGGNPPNQGQGMPEGGQMPPDQGTQQGGQAPPEMGERPQTNPQLPTQTNANDAPSSSFAGIITNAYVQLGALSVILVVAILVVAKLKKSY